MMTVPYFAAFYVTQELETYDIAFSLLGDDEPITRAIQAYLPPEVTSFLYSARQRELVVQRDGLNAFPAASVGRVSA